MAEYIDKEEIYKHLELFDKLTSDDAKHIPTADVVERSEYEFIRHQLAETMDRVQELDQINSELRSKIDKAIEEINDIPVLFIDFPLGKAQVVRKDVLMSIIKRNLGE